MSIRVYPSNKLPPHRAIPISDQDRLLLPDMECVVGDIAPGFVSLIDPMSGKFRLKPERMNGNDPMTDVSFAPRDGKIFPHDLGTIWSQAAAITLLNHARRLPAATDIDAVLAQAGFKKCPESGIKSARPQVSYEKKDKTGSYSLLVDQQSVWLTYHRRGSSYWNNLVILHTANAVHDGSGYMPTLWSPSIAHPKTAMVAMAAHMSTIWDSSLGKKAKKSPARSPK